MAVSETDRTNIHQNRGVVDNVIDYIGRHCYKPGNDLLTLADYRQSRGGTDPAVNGCSLSALLTSLKNAVDALAT